MINPEHIKNAAAAIKAADSLLITGGAGMGVDSGLPDFRGDEGFWQAYPALQQAGVSFRDIAAPDNFRDQPREAWGFYGHRLNLYRKTQPHDGFRMLREMGESMANGYFVFTSNVDGHYQKSGCAPDRILECHGSINHLQCMNNCSGIWSAEDTQIEVDDKYCTAQRPFPACPHCGSIARPNILMFNDQGWDTHRRDAQRERYQQWLASVDKLVTIECGAGVDIPTVRREGDYGFGVLIRINPRDHHASKRDAISIEAGALEAISAICREFGR